MSIELDKLESLVMNCVVSLNKTAAGLFDNPVVEIPPVLFHYTNVQGMMGILNSGEIWATNVGYLNDSKEMIHAINIAQDLIRQKLSEGHGVISNLFLRFASADIGQWYRTSRYVASFCAVEDLLSQWRGYGHTLGYALELEPDEELRSKPIFKESRLLRVVYDVEEQKRLISDCLDWYLLTYDKCDEWFDDVILNEIKMIPGQTVFPTRYVSQNEATKFALRLVEVPVLVLREELDILMISFKDPGFKEEQEWRIVYMQPTQNLDIEFKTVNGYLIPYLPLPLLWDKNTKGPGGFNLKSLAVGPCNNPKAAAVSLDTFIKRVKTETHNLYIGVDVKFSTTPYRTW